MKNIIVAAAQSASIRGELDKNISEHLRLIGVAASFGVDLMVFPELSLTGYELDLADALQLERDDPRIEPLRKAVNASQFHFFLSHIGC